ncbi:MULTISPECIES: hypothetical protein [Pseudomonas]|uniref:Uncharacterized protein n=1 Tax=Pseudomonas wuhanensis TaxID=2954098 RepID=A0ABY9GL62_9PSED|nr:MULTISPECIES: hypothetical protein [unclassified Pseudomonas]WLI10685.1 hypothetical protein PSH65_20885 [Pseudomonas sp. FP603]WLI16501.1 hypothetical protein PSH88_19510 [Pseudomonas sp. FP607]
MAQFIALIVDFIKRLQAIMSDAGTSQPDSFGETGRRQASCNERAPTQDPTQESVRPGTNRTGGRGNVPSASPVLGHQLSVQKSPQDVIALANDPERGEVIKVGFNKGHYTQNSTSPRAEIKSETLLQEGQPYRFTFGMKREADNDGTFFQVLDHNNAKPSPRAWMASISCTLKLVTPAMHPLKCSTLASLETPPKTWASGRIFKLISSATSATVRSA